MAVNVLIEKMTSENTIFRTSFLNKISRERLFFFKEKRGTSYNIGLILNEKNQFSHIIFIYL